SAEARAASRSLPRPVRLPRGAVPHEGARGSLRPVLRVRSREPYRSTHAVLQDRRGRALADSRAEALRAARDPDPWTWAPDRPPRPLCRRRGLARRARDVPGAGASARALLLPGQISGQRHPRRAARPRALDAGEERHHRRALGRRLVTALELAALE